MPTSFLLLNAATLGGGVLLPPGGVITGVGFSCGAGAAEGTLALSTTPSPDLSGLGAVNPTVLAAFVYDANVATSIFYDGLKIRLKDTQEVFVSGLGGLSTALVSVKVQTPDS